MVGGVATYKQQNVVRGLPLQLSPEEVTLALEKKWAALAPALLDEETLLLQSDSQRGVPRGRLGFRNAFAEEDDDDDEEEIGDDDDEATIWQDCLAKGSFFSIPLTPEDAAAASRPANKGEEGFNLPPKSSKSNCASSSSHAGSDGGSRRSHDVWTFPSTVEERHRYIVFRDLHERGYKLTGGLKFGADYLVYPGDPTIYHAQLCVRLLPAEKPILPIMLASACRGSFQARKHLLIASVIEIEQPRESEEQGIFSTKNVTQLDGHHYQIVYMTFGPVDGFG
jgi:tRNA-splicing endonuclease subunit Sen34